MTNDYKFYNDPQYISAYEFASKYIEDFLYKDMNFEWRIKKHEIESFEDMSFRYKKVMFSVLLKIIDEDNSILPSYTERELDWVDITEKNDLFSIVFPIKVVKSDNTYKCYSLMDGLNFWDWMSTDIMNIFDITSF